ncbi:MAG TPA: helix-turn-helix transcriptional regulator [Leifsonia sp.]|jgi:transcriptional regulator with XRE-family HTH domain|nr:helix-turn-helix transcriptional regulator [Leifsonia sp.]
MVSDGRTVDEWEQRVGAQFRELRLADNIDRKTLARQASVSVGALANLETGQGSSLRTIIRVAKALGRTEWLDAVSDIPEISPMEALRAARRQEKRVRARKTTTQ